MATRVCLKCGKTMDEATQFYTYKNGDKTSMCKKCLTMHIDNKDPETFLWILKDMDVPYVPAEWNVLYERAYAKDKNKINGMSVIGKYLSKMKLKQWKEYGWEDTEKLKVLNEEKEKLQQAERAKFEEDVQRQYDNGEINEAQYRTFMSAATQEEKYVESMTWGEEPKGADNPY